MKVSLFIVLLITMALSSVQGFDLGVVSNMTVLDKYSEHIEIKNGQVIFTFKNGKKRVIGLKPGNNESEFNNSVITIDQFIEAIDSFLVIESLPKEREGTFA